jgi:hypothetical protein
MSNYFDFFRKYDLSQKPNADGLGLSFFELSVLRGKRQELPNIKWKKL